MMICRSIVKVIGACFFVSSWLSASSLQAQQIEPPFLNLNTDRTLEADARLNQTVSVDEVGISVRDLLKKLSGKGLTLSCGPDCEQQKVHIRLNHRSLVVLMQSLADLLPGSWTPYSDQKGYRLNMTRQAARYRDEWWRLFLNERDRAIRAQQAYIVKKMRENVVFGEHYDGETQQNSPEKAKLATHLYSFYRLLPAELQEQIAAHMLTNVFYSKDGGTGFPHEGETSISLNSLPEEAQRIVREYAPSLAPNEDATIAFCNVSVSVLPRIIEPGKPPVQANMELSVGIGPDAVALRADLPGFVEVVNKRGRDAPREWKQLAAYQQSRVWKNEAVSVDEYRRQPPREAEILDWLASKTDMEFVADYYSRVSVPLSLEQKAAKPARPLNAELNQLATEQDLSWSKRADNVYLLRNNRWYRDDNMEAPGTLLQRWEAAPLPDWNAQPGKPPPTDEVMKRIQAQLELELDIFTSLTPWQISNGLEGYVHEQGSRAFDPLHPAYTWRPFTHIAQHTLNDMSLLQFYLNLSSDMRLALLNGALPYEALNAEQRERAQYLAPELKTLLARQPGVSPLLDIRCEMPVYESASGYNRDLKPVRLFNFSLILKTRP